MLPMLRRVAKRILLQSMLLFFIGGFQLFKDLSQ